MYTNKINSSIETKYRDPIGKYPRIQYWFDDNLTVNQKIDRLEKELKKEIPPNMTFEKVDDIKRFMHHFEYRYIHKLKEKVFGIYMGVFWLVWPFSNRSNWPFQLKFTRYTVNHLIVLNKAWFRHNHDPWEELPRGKPSNAVEPDVANRIKQKLPIFKIWLNKNPVLNKKHIEEISDDDVVIVDSQENLKETNKLDLNFDCNGKTNHNIIDIDISFSSNEHPFEVTTHPRKQLDTNINELKTQTRKKIKSDTINIGSFNVTQQLLSELRIKYLYGDSKEKIEEYGVSKIFGNSVPSNSDILKAKRVISGAILDSNKKYSVELNTNNLKEILAQKYEGKQEWFDIYEEGTQSSIGLLIMIKNTRNELKDYFEGYYMIDTTIQLNTWFKSKSILIYQIDKFMCISLKSIIILKTYTKEIALQALSQFYTQIERIELLFLDHDEMIINAARQLKTTKNMNYIISSYRVLSEIFKVLKEHKGTNGSDIEQNMMKFINWQSFTIAWEYWNAKIKQEAIKCIPNDDSSNLSEIINSISKNLDKIWNDELISIEFSGLFSDELMIIYSNWLKQYNKSINRNFSKAYGFLITEASLNQDALNRIVWSIIGYRLDIVSNLFLKYKTSNILAHKGKTFQEAEKLFIEHICKKYSPAVVHELLKSYILSKCCKVKIPNIAEEIAKSKQDWTNNWNNLVIKSEILITQYDENKKDIPYEFRINPQNLLWSCRKYIIQGIAWCHLIAYLVQGLNLFIDDVWRNGYLISPEWIVSDTDRLEKLYMQYLNSKTPSKFHQRKSVLKQLELVVLNYESKPKNEEVKLVFLSDEENESESDPNKDEEYKNEGEKENLSNMKIKNWNTKKWENTAKQQKYNLRKNNSSYVRSNDHNNNFIQTCKGEKQNSKIMPKRWLKVEWNSVPKTYSEFIANCYPPSLS